MLAASSWQSAVSEYALLAIMRETLKATTTHTRRNLRAANKLIIDPWPTAAVRIFLVNPMNDGAGADALSDEPTQTYVRQARPTLPVVRPRHGCNAGAINPVKQARNTEPDPLASAATVGRPGRGLWG